MMKELKLDGKLNEMVIIKNIPELNWRLWRVKHLIKITPITFPDGFPKDNQGTYLKENGELEVKKRLIASDLALKKSEEFREDPRRMDGKTKAEFLRRKWLAEW